MDFFLRRRRSRRRRLSSSLVVESCLRVPLAVFMLYNVIVKMVLDVPYKYTNLFENSPSRSARWSVLTADVGVRRADIGLYDVNDMYVCAGSVCVYAIGSNVCIHIG